jgi:WD40 repeat protein/DNA-binding SARP family transcriptional activator
MSNLTLRFFGSYRVTLDGEPVTAFESDKVRALLAYLAVKADRPHRREKLVRLLWPDWPERSARQNLSRALYELRSVIGDREADQPFLAVTRQTIQFEPDDRSSVDVATFARLIVECHQHDHPRPETCDPCRERLEEAVALYEGDFLEGFSLPDSAPFEDWMRTTRERLREQALEALHCLSAGYEAHERMDDALAQARRAVELDPCWEKCQRDLMRLLALSGQATAALAQYERFQLTLEAELGGAPSEETQELHQLLLEGKRPPAITAATQEHRPRPVGACPYRGLAAFREEDAPFFFGRDAFTDRLSQAVRAQSLVAVIVGPSGSGKSSAVFAGLLPQLEAAEAGRWVAVTLRPGGQPFLAIASALLPLLDPGLGEVNGLVESSRLAGALREGDISLKQIVDRALAKAPTAKRLLLVIDQFEELFTLCPDRALQQRLLDTLLAAAAAMSDARRPSLAILLALRADFMAQALSHRPFADALQDRTILLGPMSRDELKEAIEKPAEMEGAAFEAGLVDRMLDDVGQEPGNLPLLEFALTLLWENHDHGWLTHARYESIGRVEGALARYADEVYGELDPEEQAHARQILVQLVRPGEGTEDTRRAATRAELGAGNWPLAQHLADRRLVVTGRDRGTGGEIVEVVHEALIQRWGQLRDWMDEDRAFRTWQERLRTAMRGWEASERDEGALLRGAPLLEAENWLAEREGELSEVEWDYVQAGAALRERQQAERERRRRVTVAALAGGLVIALILTAIALVARHQATLAEALAVDEREEARRQASIGLAAQALAELEGDYPERSVLLALEALERYPYTAQAESALARIVQEFIPATLPGLRATWSPDGAFVATFPSDDIFNLELVILDTRTGADVQSFRVPTGDATCLLDEMVWSPAGDRLAVTTYATGVGVCPAVTIWDLASGRLLLSLPPEIGDHPTVAWSADESALFTGGDDGLLHVWDAASGTERLALAAHAGRIEDVTISPAGNLLATASADGTVRVWDVATLLALSQAETHDPEAEKEAQRYTLIGHLGGVMGVDWKPDGSAIVTASQDGTARIWSLPQAERGPGQVLLTLFGHDAPVVSVAWSPDGRHIATLGEDNSARMWDATIGMELFREPCQVLWVPIPRVAWSPAGELVCRTPTKTWAWDVSRTTLQLIGHTDNVWGARWSPDGTRIATASLDGTARIWDGATGEELLAVKGPGRLSFAAWSPDGTRIVTTGWGGPALVWDAITGELLLEFTRPPGEINFTADWSPDGSRIAVASAPVGAVQIFDATTGEMLVTTEEKGCNLHYPNWSPGGDWLVTGCENPPDGAYPDGKTPARIWDAETGKELLSLQSNIGWTIKGVWSPAGDKLAITHGDGGPDWALDLWRITSDPERGTLAAEELLSYAGHSALVWETSWSPDGKRIASSDERRSVQIWDVDTGDTVYSFQTPGFALSLDWTPDGKYLVAAGQFPAPLVLPVWSSTEELIDYAYDCCVTRELTAGERAQFGLPPAEGDR